MAHGGPSKRKPNNNIDDNNSEEDELPPPPDGGWGWVIVIASFLIHIISKYLIAPSHQHIFHIYIQVKSFISVFSWHFICTHPKHEKKRRSKLNRIVKPVGSFLMTRFFLSFSPRSLGMHMSRMKPKRKKNEKSLNLSDNISLSFGAFSCRNKKDEEES